MIQHIQPDSTPLPIGHNARCEIALYQDQCFVSDLQCNRTRDNKASSGPRSSSTFRRLPANVSRPRQGEPYPCPCCGFFTSGERGIRDMRGVLLGRRRAGRA